MASISLLAFASFWGSLGEESCFCSHPLAVLISGQLSRFHLEGFQRVGGVAALLRGGASCSPAFGAFVALGRLRATEFHTGRTSAGGAFKVAALHAAPGESLAFVGKVKSFFGSQGARECRVAVLDDAHMASVNHSLAMAISQRGAELAATTPKRYWEALTSLRNFHDKWKRNGRMFYLRSVSYQLALASSQPFAWFLYLREDAYFYETPQPPLGTFAGRFANRSGPVVGVDSSGCRFGYLSDKAYLANRDAADVLFGATMGDHEDALLAWCNQALLSVDSTTRIRPAMKDQPLQTEYFLQMRLLSAGCHVGKIRMHRVDLRAMHPSGTGREGELRYCVPQRYFSCLPHGRRPVDLVGCDDLANAGPSRAHSPL